MTNKEITKELQKSLTNKQRNILKEIPKLYHYALYCLIVLDITEQVIEGARESGKTMYFQNLILIFAELFPEADIVVTRETQKEHMRGLVPRIQNILRDGWLIELLPSLREFYWDNTEMWFVRVHPNGHKQKIWFIGESRGGVQSNKSVSPDGYFSLVLKDEAEGNNNTLTATSSDDAKKLTEDKKRTFRRRDYVKYKDYSKYPRTKFAYAYNPKEENGEFEELMDQYLKPNIKQLTEKGFQMTAIPNYKNGSGIVLIRNNINHLINDNKKFHPAPESVKEANWFKENEPTIYRMDYLGIRYENETAFFNHYKPVLRHKIDKQSIPISIGLDQGLSDDVGIVLNMNEYVKEGKNIIFTQVNGAAYELEVKGKRLMTSKAAKEHITYAAREIVRFIVNNVFADKEWIEWYKKNQFYITTGHKDKWLLSEIEEIFEKEYPKLDKMLSYVEIKEVTTSYDLESRIKQEQSQNKKRTNIVSDSLTPKTYRYYMRYGLNNYKDKNWKGANLIDAYFYSKYRFYDEIKEDKKVYNIYENNKE